MSEKKLFTNFTTPENLIDILESSYRSWYKKVKKIRRELGDLKSIETTITIIELTLREMGVEGFEQTT